MKTKFDQIRLTKPARAVRLAVVFIALGSGAMAAGYTDRGQCSLLVKPQDARRLQIVVQEPCLRQFGSGTGVFGITYLFETGRKVAVLAENYNGDDFMEYLLDNKPAVPHAEPPFDNDECFAAAGPAGLTMLCFKGLDDDEGREE